MPDSQYFPNERKRKKDQDLPERYQTYLEIHRERERLVNYCSFGHNRSTIKIKVKMTKVSSLWWKFQATNTRSFIKSKRNPINQRATQR